jgi:Tol biopolymer transport system component
VGSPPVLNGWAAFASGSSTGTSDIYLVREGEAPHRIVVEGSDTASELCPAFSPDGERLIFWSGIGNPTDWYHDGALVVATVADDGSVMPLTTVPLAGGVDPTCATWAPDGRWIAFADGGAVSVADTTTTEVRRLVNYIPSDLEWRPGTDELAIAGKVETVEESLGWSNGPLVIYSVSTGQTRTVGDLEVRDVAWSPDGQTLAYTQYFLHGSDCIECTSGISLIDADGSNERPLTTTHHRAYGPSEISIQWSPRGDLIAYGRPCDACGYDTEIVLVNVTADDPATPIGTETILAPPLTETAGGFREWYPASFSWAPDGTGLLYALPDGPVVVPIDSDRRPQELTDHSELNPAPVPFSPYLRTQQWGRD